MPAPNAAQEAMGVLVVIAQESMPEGQNQGGGNDAREKFDEAVDEMFVVLVKKRKELEGDDFDISIKKMLVKLKGISAGLEEFSISPTFEKSIPLLESWIP
ncbi:hypothetical protein GSI_01681 [Ganoderma sinense ZZ0214-1]|uniref:Uncharacterized protein n=1 Tax=Ganoderma sinense ZZ0214-1 TaxID=1077348 RepID=A0A2G8SQH4_9APHY|nr:hypothetical protein GSI_01681 [Ganoderma sinense ZZ0214-1]